jgi:hypothetical protein
VVVRRLRRISRDVDALPSPEASLAAIAEHRKTRTGGLEERPMARSGKKPKARLMRYILEHHVGERQMVLERFQEDLVTLGGEASRGDDQPDCRC